MTAFITGASGYVGHKLAHALATKGCKVHALVRNDAGKKVLQNANIVTFKGDVLAKRSLLEAMAGCRQVYHTAAKVGAWSNDPSDFDKVNVEGTKNVVEAALETGVEKMVFTSTAGVFGPSRGEPVLETHQRILPFTIDYDRTKKEAEELLVSYSKGKMEIITVSPAKIYGPGHTSHSLTANSLIQRFLKTGIAVIPQPGTNLVCFAYIDDVVEGHILAMKKGVAGETYILGGNNVSYHDFFHTIRILAGGKGRIVSLPKTIIKAAAYGQEISHRFFGTNISFSVKSVDHLFNNFIFSSNKAINCLGYNITSLNEALTKTIYFLNATNHA